MLNLYFQKRPAIWLSPALFVICLLLVIAEANQGCSGSQPQVVISDPTSLCANAIVLNQEVRSQAAKIGLEPIELARKTCEAAILAAKLAEANLVKSSGAAGAPALLLPNYSNAAGAGGLGG